MRDVPTSPQPLPEDELQASAVISLVVVEDNRLLREGLCELLRRQSGFVVLDAAADGAVIDCVFPRVPRAILLLDVGLRDDDSLSICQDVHTRFPEVRIIVMGMAPHHDDIAGFVHAGAVGFIRKDATTSEFASTVRHVARGETSLPRALTESLFAEIMRQPQQLSPQALAEGMQLTAREKEIVALLGEGLSNKDIAARLHIAIHTVKSHVHNVLEKLSLHSRLEVVAYSRVSKGSR